MLRISVFAPFAKQDTLKFPMGKKGIIVSQIREQYPLLAQEVSGDLPRNLILFIKGGLSNLLTKGIDDLATPPEPERFFLGPPDAISRDAYLRRLNG